MEYLNEYCWKGTVKTFLSLDCETWLQKMKQRYHRVTPHRLTPQQERAWENAYAEAHRYYATHGNLEMPARYVTESGFKLGSWLANMRHAKESLKPERADRLNTIGMRW